MTLFIEVKLYGGTGTDFSWRYRNTLILNFSTKMYRSKLHRAKDCLGWLSIMAAGSGCPARVPIGREYQMAVSTRCIDNFHTFGILDTVGGTKFSL